MDYIGQIKTLKLSDRIKQLKDKMLTEPRYLSLEQANIITQSYKENSNLPRILQRAKSLALTLERINIRIEPEELIIGNRTPGVRGGVVFPEAGISWLDQEIEGLADRPQDKFNVRPEDIKQFRAEILPYWKGKSLEDNIREEAGALLDSISLVVKVNQKDHAQGHICPDIKKWLTLGPGGLQKIAAAKLLTCNDKNKELFYESTVIVLAATRKFIKRYARLAAKMSETENRKTYKNSLKTVSQICDKLADYSPESFHEAIQGLWFLFVVLQLESNASSFSPGRMDQDLYPYFQNDLLKGKINLELALELIESLWLKFNQIVYMRNLNSAKYFAGFPIGFNVALGGQTIDGQDASNELSYLFLKAQEHLLLPQPNLSARLFQGTPDSLLNECSRVIGLGSGMPQIFNDESIIPALENRGIKHRDAIDYAIVGCVELSTQGNYLGWSDAAMFNLVKVLELALNNGICLLTGEQIGLQTGYLPDFHTYDEFEIAFMKQIDYFIVKMIAACEAVEKIHMRLLPSPFLSCVISDCLEKGLDVTAGGAHYNLSGIQAIQVANIADSLAAIKKMVYDDQKVSADCLLLALQANFKGCESLRQLLLNHVPKYGNDVEWVDKIGLKWVEYFTTKLNLYRNLRGGPYHTGLYTVSAHVPMGQNVGATPDGRYAKAPLADGGMSAVYGRDLKGPTALLKSVSRINSLYGSNGTLLNMKFLPDFFQTEARLQKFSAMLKAFLMLKINHVQFNVVSQEDLIAAQREPEKYRNLIVRVAGYTAYFTELAGDLQNEIIARTSYGDV